LDRKKTTTTNAYKKKKEPLKKNKLYVTVFKCDVDKCLRWGG